MITSIHPSSIAAGGPDFLLTVVGDNFPEGAVITWNGTVLQTQAVGANGLQADIGSQMIAAGGNVTIEVTTPLSSSIHSAGATLAVDNPVPTLDFLSPASRPVGGQAFTLTVGGTGFNQDSVVEWNGSPRPTAFIHAGELTASIGATDLASMQMASVTVVNAAPEGGSSGPEYVPVYRLLAQTANDIAWDPIHGVLYASVPSSTTSHADTVLTLDPDTGAILSAQSAGSDPDTLALSGDDAYLYVGEDNSYAVQRFTLPGMTPDITWGLGSGIHGSYFALDLQVAPGAPHTVAVALGNSSVSSECAGIVIYDDSTPRTTTASGSSCYDSLQWGGTDSVLFSADNYDSSGDFYILAVDPSGVTQSSVVPGRVSVFQHQAIHYDASTGDIYGDGGEILSPTGVSLGAFKPIQAISGAVAVDSSIDRAFMVTDAGGGYWGFDIVSYDLATRSPINSLTFIGTNELTASKVVRWGSDGLALLVNNGFVRTGQILLIKGPFVH